MTLIDQALPSYDRREFHRRRIDAPPAAIWDAAKDLRSDEMTLMRVLMDMRTLGRRRGDDSRTVLQAFEWMGFRVVDEELGREFVVGGLGRFWQLSGGLRRVEGRDHFTSFGEPRYAKVAFNFRLEGNELSTETRIASTDAHARRRFGAYWLLVRPGSGLIRREWLRAIDKRAQATQAAKAPPSDLA
jgi:hypothetical protein